MTNKLNVLSLIDTHKYLRREMIQQALQLKERNCQYMLCRMAKADLLNRFKLSRDDSYIYHTGKRSEKWRHWLMINDFHFALQAALKPGQRVLYYQLEYRYSHGQSDGVYAIQTHRGGGVLFFLEMDDGANQFDKVEKYERYYLSRQWVKEIWSDPLNKGVSAFPMVVVVTPRAKEIQKLAAQANKVAWRVYGDSDSAVKGVLTC